MTELNRRTYVKGALASSAAVMGMAGVGSVFADPGNGKGGGGGGGNPGGKNQCLPPNVELAKYEWIESDAESLRDSRTTYVNCEDGAFVPEDGGSDLVWLTLVECDDDHEPVYVEWASSVPVYSVSVKHGQEIEDCCGGIRSGYLDLAEFDVSRFAFSNIVFCERPAQAILCDDSDWESFQSSSDLFLSHMHLEDHKGQSAAVHVDSHDNATSDYASGTVNVAHAGFTLDDVQTNDEVIEYLFAVGEDNSNAMPDEVFLVLETPDQAANNSDPKADDVFTVAYLTGNLAEPLSDEMWDTRNVTAEMGGTVPPQAVSHKWHVDEAWVDDSDHDSTAEPGDGNLNDPTAPGGVIFTAKELRDDPDVGRFVDLFVDTDDFPLDTRILGVGFGYGYTTAAMNPDVDVPILDGYFDDLVIGPMDSGDSIPYDEPIPFPAAVPMGVEFSGDDPIEATLTFEQTEVGVESENVVPETVILTDLWKFAPTTPTSTIPHVSATSVEVDGNSIVATFDETAVEGLLGPIDGQTAIVTGDFDVPRVVSFVATRELPGGGD